MDYSLNIAALLRRAEQFHPESELVTRLDSGAYHRYRYTDLGSRARRLASALAKTGLRHGERVATLCRTHFQHVELYYAAPIAGFVTHPVNPRLSAEDIQHILTHAEDRLLFIDYDLLSVYREIDVISEIKQIIVVNGLDGAELPPAMVDYERFLATGADNWTVPHVDENATALVTYTSGTTGQPKGVEVSHRALVVHAMSICLGDALGFTDDDVVMPVVPMFHALAWGWPYAAAMVGAKQVLPGRQLDPETLLSNIARERVTVTGGVPTIWMGLLHALDNKPDAYDVSSLRAILSGGSSAPEAMIDGFQDRHGLKLVHTWGMTELIMGAVSRLPASLRDASPETRKQYRRKQGRPMTFMEIRARGENGALIPWDGQSLGELEVAGPWVASAYLGSEPKLQDKWTADGWLCTGDIVTIDAHGYIDIQDRSKDLIKSGGEWISTPMLENALMAHSAVAEAAVIAVPHTKWGERPLALVRFHPDARIASDALRTFIAAKLPRWSLPDAIVAVEEIPKTAVGKFDKKTLRERYANHYAR